MAERFAKWFFEEHQFLGGLVAVLVGAVLPCVLMAWACEASGRHQIEHELKLCTHAGEVYRVRTKYDDMLQACLVDCDGKWQPTSPAIPKCEVSK